MKSLPVIASYDITGTIRLTSRTSTLSEVDEVKAKLAQSRESMDLMNSVVLPPGMSAKDLMKLRHERRAWRSPNASAYEGDMRLKDIEEEREAFIKEQFSQHGDPTSPHLTKDQLDRLEQITKEAERVVKEKLKEPSDDDIHALVRQRKPSSLVRRLRKLSKAGLEEQTVMKAKFGEDRVKNKLKFSERMFANKSDAFERRSRLLVK